MGERVSVAVIGAGYAGLAAAAELAARGIPATVFEASRTLGGRARRLEKDGLVLDNGQHILVGAYTELLRLMDLVGADADALLQRLPLSLVFPGHMELRAPRLPAPLHLAAALFTAHGLPFAARLAALRFMRAMKRCGFRLAADMPLAALLDAHGQPGALRRFLWEPLCISALNTPPAVASAQVFLNVLRDSLAASRAASDLLLARTDFSALFPEPAERFIQAGGGEVLRGTPIHGISRQDEAFRLTGDPQQRGFTHVVAAVAPYHLADLVAKLPELEAATGIVQRFDYEPILTCYLRYAQPIRFPAPMVGIAGGTAHFLFARNSPGEAHGLVSAVISAGGPHLELSREELVARIHGEVQGIAGRLPAPERAQVVTEKRATFACRPGVLRPQAATPLRNFFLCGDYVASDYPATLESAVRSGVACARLIASTGG
jgi:squalene-associated FAD-dependent desaturase